MKLRYLVCAAVSAIVAGGAAHAATFAEYEAVSNGGLSSQNIQWVGSPGAGTLSAVPPSFGATANVLFTFLEGDASNFVMNVPALFTMDLHSSLAPSVSASGVIEQDGLSGTFSFTYQGSSPITFDGHTYTTGANLLTGNVSGAYLTGHQSSPTGGVFDATTYGTVTYSSAFVNIDNATGDRAFSIEMTDISPFLSAAGGFLNNFGATSTGSFQASLLNGGGQGVPEPASWALMIFGVAGMGSMLRLQRRRAAAQV